MAEIMLFTREDCLVSYVKTLTHQLAIDGYTVDRWEITKWCAENFGTDDALLWDDEQSGWVLQDNWIWFLSDNYDMIYFANEQDKLLFKLAKR